jgi:hypothetical protein
LVSENEGARRLTKQHDEGERNAHLRPLMKSVPIVHSRQTLKELLHRRREAVVGLFPDFPVSFLVIESGRKTHFVSRSPERVTAVLGDLVHVKDGEVGGVGLFSLRKSEGEKEEGEERRTSKVMLQVRDGQ